MRGELRSEISSLRSVLGEALAAKCVDVIPIPGTQHVLRKTCSDTKKAITSKVLLSVFEAVFDRYQGKQTSALDLSSVVQQALRQAITTSRVYGDVVPVESKQATRKPRGVHELVVGEFTADDREHVELCLELAHSKGRLASLPRPTLSYLPPRQTAPHVVGQQTKEPTGQQTKQSAGQQTEQLAGQPAEQQTKQLAKQPAKQPMGHLAEQQTEQHVERLASASGTTTPPPTPRKRPTIKLSEALRIVDAACSCILPTNNTVPVWSVALAGHLQALIAAELGG